MMNCMSNGNNTTIHLIVELIKTNLASPKTEVDKLDIDKLTH